MTLQTYDAYRDFLAKFLTNGYRFFTVHQAATRELETPCIILRHECERSARRATAIAAIEHELGITSTLYVRKDTRAYNRRALLELQDCGFEIGYHYNTLDRTHGDFDAALRLFERDLQDMRDDGIVVNSAAAHGDPWRRRRGYTWNWELIQRSPDLLTELALENIGPWGTRFPLQGPILDFSDANLQWNRGEVTARFFAKAARTKAVPRLFLLVHAD